ncbi:MAG: molybdopterin dinucleotide binding domain-containing protein, partial [Eubacteriales bacterium]
IANKVGFLPDMNNFLSHAEFYTAISKDMPQALAPQYFLDPEKQYTYEEIIERKIKSDYGPESGYQDFEDCAFKPYRLSLKESYNYYFVPENKIRLPLYFNSINHNIKELLANLKKYNTTVPDQDMEHFRRHYCGLPMWYESISNGTTPEYPFKVVNWKVHYIINNTGDHVENPWLDETVNTFSPELKKVWINTATALELGFKEDDEITIESQFGGKTNGKLHLTNLIHTSCIGIPGNYGRKGMLMNPISYDGAHYNALIDDDEPSINPVMGNIENSPRVKIYKD